MLKKLMSDRHIHAASLLVLFLIVLGLSWISTKADAELNVSTGYQTVATPTLTLVSSYPTIIGQMPLNCSQVEVIASGASINYGPSNITNSTLWPYIADGAQKTFDDLRIRNPKLYFVIRGATTTAKIGFVAK